MLLGSTSRKELSAIFKISTRRIHKILRELGIEHRLPLLPIEVAMFKNKVGDLVRVGD